MRYLRRAYAYAKAIYTGYQGGEILSTMILGIIGALVGESLFTFLQQQLWKLLRLALV